MIQSVENFLDEYGLKTPDKTFLVGFSGGCDSLCLLDVLKDLSKKYKFKLVALHLNHNWRGQESLNDELNCKDFCKKNKIEFISETLKEGPKTETYARESRYNFFLKHARKYKNSCVFTAHTQTDNAETIIYRIVKGTGINGLQGIQPRRIIEDIPVYRPLLNVSRKEIEAYCASKNLSANIDSSNDDTHYKRNFIRHKIIPLFNEINAQSEQAIASMAQVAKEEAGIVDEYLLQIKSDLFEGNKILTDKFKHLSKNVMMKIIYDICIDKNLDYDYEKINNIFSFIKENISSKSGTRYSLTNDLWLFVSYKHIYLINKIKADVNMNTIHINSTGDWKIPDTKYVFSIKEFTCAAPSVYPYESYMTSFCSGQKNNFPPESAYLAYVNLDVTGLDLTVRTRREGDFIVPFGMFGSMKLKKYLTEKEIPQHDKDSLILLCKDSEVLWVAGVGLSNKLKVVNRPTHVIELGINAIE